MCRIRTSMIRVVPIVSRLTGSFLRFLCGSTVADRIRDISRFVDHILQTHVSKHLHIVDKYGQLHERLEVCGSAVKGRTVDLGYAEEEVVLVRVLHEEMLGDPLLDPTTHYLIQRPISEKVFWTRVWVATLPIVSLVYSAQYTLVYIEWSLRHLSTW